MSRKTVTAIKRSTLSARMTKVKHYVVFLQEEVIVLFPAKNAGLNPLFLPKSKAVYLTLPRNIRFQHITKQNTAVFSAIYA